VLQRHSENDFSKFVTGIEPVHWTVVDQRMLGIGLPDLDYCYKGIEGHIELKVRPILRDTQKRWFRNRVHYGGRPMVWWAPINGDHIYIFKGMTVVNRLLTTTNAATWRGWADDRINQMEPNCYTLLSRWLGSPSGSFDPG